MVLGVLEVRCSKTELADDRTGSASGVTSTTKERTGSGGSKSGDSTTGTSETPGGGGGDPVPPGGTVGGPSPTAFNGEEYFLKNVEPVFQEKCGACHAPPRKMPATPAPLSIFAYERMIALLSNGASSGDNDLVNKMRARTAHGGGDMCQAGIEATPCLEVVNWWKKQLGAGRGDFKTVGELKAVSDTGTVGGWAQDAAAGSTVLQIKLYVDAPSGQSQPVATITANKSGYGYEGHAFGDPLPPTAIDGKPHKVYGYAIVNNAEVPLIGSPLTYTAYKGSANGQQFFDANVKNAWINACGGCHGGAGAATYDQKFGQLLSPSKARGGTASNNVLVQKGAALISHSGGNACGGANAGVCAQFQQWWTMEFGAL